MASLEEILDRAESVTVREIGSGKKRYEVIVGNQLVGKIEGKEKMSSRYEFRLTLEDGTYKGKICENFSATGHHSEAYDAQDSKVLEFRRTLLKEKIPFTRKVWGEIKGAGGDVLARMSKHGEELHFELFDIRDADGGKYVGSIEQCDKAGRHTYEVTVPVIGNAGVALFAAMLDQLFYHNKGIVL